jgi:hypothetical protein
MRDWPSPWLPPAIEDLLRGALRNAIVPLAGQVFCR